MTEPNAAQAPEDADGAAEVPLVLLSHRGPVTFDRGESGRTESRSGGGVVTALAGLAEHLTDAMWVCATSSAEDAAAVREADGQAVLVSIGAEPEIVPARGPVRARRCGFGWFRWIRRRTPPFTA